MRWQVSTELLRACLSQTAQRRLNLRFCCSVFIEQHHDPSIRGVALVRRQQRELVVVIGEVPGRVNNGDACPVRIESVFGVAGRIFIARAVARIIVVATATDFFL